MSNLNTIISTFDNILSNTELLALLLNFIIKDAKLTTDDYIIFAGYGLYKFRLVTDLDVMVSKNGFKKLKALTYIKNDMAKLSKTKKLYIKFPSLGNDTEIEFFELENKGFQNNNFSLRSLQAGKHVTFNSFNNPY